VLWDSDALRIPATAYAQTLSVSVKRQPTHIQAHLVLPDTQSRPFAKPKELEFFKRTDDRNKK
jgi:hypothetical protein